MKWVIAFAAALAVSGCAQNMGAHSDSTSAKSWSSALDENCRRCVPSNLVLKYLPFPLPKRAIVYGFTGEFASRADTWVIDLDTGEIVHWESVPNEARVWKNTASRVGIINGSALENLRTSAVSLWTSEPYNLLGWVSPGADEEDEVVSGAQLVAFSRFAPNDHGIVAAINSALPADATRTNGSFVVRPPRT